MHVNDLLESNVANIVQTVWLLAKSMTTFDWSSKTLEVEKQQHIIQHNIAWQKGLQLDQCKTSVVHTTAEHNHCNLLDQARKYSDHVAYNLLTLLKVKHKKLKKIPLLDFYIISSQQDLLIWDSYIPQQNFRL